MWTVFNTEMVLILYKIFYYWSKYKKFQKFILSTKNLTIGERWSQVRLTLFSVCIDHTLFLNEFFANNTLSRIDRLSISRLSSINGKNMGMTWVCYWWEAFQVTTRKSQSLFDWLHSYRLPVVFTWKTNDLRCGMRSYPPRQRPLNHPLWIEFPLPHSLYYIGKVHSTLWWRKRTRKEKIGARAVGER